MLGRVLLYLEDFRGLRQRRLLTRPPKPTEGQWLRTFLWRLISFLVKWFFLLLLFLFGTGLDRSRIGLILHVS